MSGVRPWIWAVAAACGLASAAVVWRFAAPEPREAAPAVPPKPSVVAVAPPDAPAVVDHASGDPRKVAPAPAHGADPARLAAPPPVAAGPPIAPTDPDPRFVPTEPVESRLEADVAVLEDEAARAARDAGLPSPSTGGVDRHGASPE